jgi:hypothetical protein
VNIRGNAGETGGHQYGFDKLHDDLLKVNSFATEITEHTEIEIWNGFTL